MKEYKTHIILKISALLLVIAILAPTIVKFSHGFENHEHEVCYGETSDHLHQIDIDCELCKFKLNTPYNHSIAFSTSPEVIPVSNQIFSWYNFTSDYQKLSVRLRGPPTLV